MGRNLKKGVDYFPHSTIAALTSSTIYTIESEFGNDGYALWFKLLEYIGISERLLLDRADKSKWLYFVAKSKVGEERAVSIIDRLADIGAIDEELWKEHGIIWSDNFVASIEDVYKKRGVPPPQKPTFGETKKIEEDKAPPQQGELEIPDEQPPEQKPKKKYAEKVHLTEKEYDELVEKYGKAGADRAIEILSNYKGSKGKSYKSDYRAILSWVIDRMKEKEPHILKKTSPAVTSKKAGENPFGDYME